ncbi:MAG TPA: hypothetical protein VJ715_11525 [Pyrinomonadaceae bacterium]|nr:hypothetical protein [Pyrinomonadaceae bacterium]
MRDSRSRRALDRAANNGRPLQVEMTVRGNVTAQAVLIPRVDARRIFGSEIANNYAVIEVNVGNKSPDAALIIHGIFIDYSRWALSGTSSQPPPNMVNDILRQRAEPFQASTIPSQVASEEYRVVRGQLLDAQMWTKRNWVMRLLTFAGSLAGAYAFSLNEEGIIRGLNAFSGVVVPGFREVWPDGTIEQLNRISDFGYQANKVIPKQGSEVIVCFFPIDRFLTPGFKKLFLESPALFFSPLQMLADAKLRKKANIILSSIDDQLSAEKLNKSLPCYLQIVNKVRFRSDAGVDENNFAEQLNRSADQTCYREFGLMTGTDGKIALGNTTGDIEGFKKFMALDFISQMSLNNVNVMIDGVMTIDTTNLAAGINEVAFDNVADCGGPETPCFWADPAAADGVRTGTLSGSYMTGGTLVIAEADELDITDLKVIAEGSNDQKLRFSFKLTKPVPADKRLHFSVTKTQGGTAGANVTTISSLVREYRVGYTLQPPRIEMVSREADTLTVNGSSFFDLPDNALVVEMLPPGGGDAVEVPRSSIKVSHNRLVFPVPENARTAGCWKVVVKVGVFSSPPMKAGCQ